MPADLCFRGHFCCRRVEGVAGSPAPNRVRGGVETGCLGKGTGRFCRGTALAVANAVNFLTVMELYFIRFLAVSGNSLIKSRTPV